MTSDLLTADKYARQQALDASKSFIVQAPAGSGKTELLIQRFLTLLKIVKTPEEILAMTFTKKAANEMRTRVINALKAALSPAPESAHAQLTWNIANEVLKRDAQYNWNIIQNPNRLRIQTIDALCTFLTKQLPLLSHFGSQPDITMQPEALYREAVKEVLLHVEEKYEWSHAIAKLLLHLDNDFNKLHDLLVSLLQKRDQWLPYIALDTNDEQIRHQLEQQLCAVIHDSLQKLVDIFPHEHAAELVAIVRYSANNLVANKSDLLVTVCAELNELPGSTASEKKLWEAIAKVLLTNEGTWRKMHDNRIGFPAPSSTKNVAEKKLYADYKNRAGLLIESLQDNELLRQTLEELSTLPDEQYTETQWEILQSLLVVLKVLAAQLRLTFQQYGQIDFVENAQAALLALGTEDHPTDLALALDYQIKHLLVDEFQDTSFTQYQLIEKLTSGWENNDGRTLFVVGDPMQSIYRFRQAEVGLFIRMRKSGIGNVKLTPLNLTVNFRSLAPIVEWNNNHFEHIFPSFSDIATGAVNYSHSMTLREDNVSAEIVISGYTTNDTCYQTAKVITEIKRLKQNYPQDSIAILVRSRSNLTTLMPALSKEKISYKAIEIDPLAARQHVQDLLSLTCALLHLADRIAWLAILRAPWCGLTLADLLVIGGEPNSIIWDRLNTEDVFAQLSIDGKQRLARIIPILGRKLAERERYDLRTWIESTWVLLGGPACLGSETAIEDAKQYLNLLSEFTQSSRILNVESLQEKIQTLFASASSEANAIQIMTIHAAKGLEFDSVILPHLEKKITGNEKSLLQWMDRPLTNNQNALLLAPIHATGQDKDKIYEYINKQEKIKTNFEIDRLLYVATTRAKKRLLLFYSLKTDAANKADSNSFLGRLLPLLEAPEVVNDISSQLQENKRSRCINRIVDDWKNPITENTNIKIAYHNKQSGFQLINQQPKYIGIVLHAVFQQIAIHGFDWWENKSEQNRQNYLKFHLSQQGITKALINGCMSKAEIAIENTLKDPRGRWILQAHNEHSSELALTAEVEGRIENLVIDRTFVHEGVRWIIDYKTTTFDHDDLQSFLATEQEKYLQKMQIYKQALSRIDNRPIKMGLYFPALPAWQEC